MLQNSLPALPIVLEALAHASQGRRRSPGVELRRMFMRGYGARQWTKSHSRPALQGLQALYEFGVGFTQRDALKNVHALSGVLR
jgi:hypothetical protein